MRRLLIWGASFLVLWCLWWVAASLLIQKGAAVWLQQQRSNGMQAEAEVTQSGFPLRLKTTLAGVVLADPVSDTDVHAEKLVLTAPTYWPGYMTLDLPHSPIILTLAGQEIRLRVSDARADLRLHPGTSLQLQDLTVRSGAWMLSAAPGALLSADHLDLAVTQDANAPSSYALSIVAAALSPGDAMRQFLGLPESWPRAFDSFVARLAVRFDTPWNRHALAGPRPQPRLIDLSELNIGWGELRLTGNGALVISDTGIPEGSLSFRLTNWQQVLDMATTAGLLDNGLRNQAQLLMGGLANLGGGGPDLDLTLTFANGLMALGPIQLGSAPRVILR